MNRYATLRLSVIRDHSARRAFSLLEVLLALAILAGAMTVIGSLMNGGFRNAAEARDLGPLQMAAQSIMGRIAAGDLPASQQSETPLDEDDQWVYSVAVDDAGSADLLLVHVTVGPAEPDSRAADFTLSRIMIDPGSAIANPEDEEEEAEESSDESDGDNNPADDAAPDPNGGNQTPPPNIPGVGDE